MSSVTIKQVRKAFGPQTVLHGVDLEIRTGEFMVLVGPSGCGKSTLLRMVAGLEDPTGGEIAIDGRVVNEISPKDRGVAMVFQNYALYPHMTVADNMGFALKLAHVPKDEIRRRVNEAAETLGLTASLAKKPGQLSGGQKQRVAMGRAMVRKPKVFLFDEPLSNLDAQLRVRMRSEISLLHRKLGATIIYVTHDQTEAMTLASRIAVLNGGRLEQVGAPLDVYHQPRTQFVASFIGTPSMNFLPRDGKTMGFRPETTRFLAGDGDFSVGRGRVTLVEPLGLNAHVHVAVGDNMLVAEGRVTDAPALDAQVELFVAPRDVFYFGADGARLS